MDALLQKVLKRIKPTPQEERRIKRVEEKVRSLLEEMKGDFSFQEIVFTGSTAHGTNLRGSSDIDVFLLYPKDVERNRIEEEVKEMARRLGGTLLYAEHPYFRLKVDGVDVDVVPAYKIREGERILSATDRTPLHNIYVLRHLDERKKDEVRLLKAFLKGIGAYGAEIRVEGFSGYLCELLIIKYGDFLSVLKAAANWRKGEYIDLEGKGRIKERRPLIVVDPVDPERNVAHAVSEESLSLFITAARAFLREPSERFFFPRRPRLSPSKVKELLDERRSRVVLVATRYKDGFIPDNVWGQLKRFERLFKRQMEIKDNFVLQTDAWTDEKDWIFLLAEIGGRYEARIHKVMGPPVFEREHAERFLEVHRNDPFGPYIEGDRLIAFREVEEKSLLIEAMETVEEIVKGKSIGGELGKALSEGFEIVEGRGILRYWNVKGFPCFVSDFLLRKFPWEY